MSTNTPAPVVLVILATLLISCNVLWLYTTPDNTPRSVCGNLVDSWTGGHAGVQEKEANVTVSMSGVHDYQLVRGSGLTDVPFPIPIPNDTVILGDDAGHDDGLRQRYVTIGIASVWRKEEYLHRTLDSLLRETTEQDKKDIFIFLLLADADPDVRQSRARGLQSRYKPHIESGIIRVLQPPSLLYPSIDFTSIRRTYNDSVSRVQWRTKQVLDFAFLFWYTWVRQPSSYYLILEDDVLAARHFVTAVRDFVSLHSKREWVALQLSSFMGIGQLIRCRDLDRLVSFLLLFYKEHPVDVLFSHWVTLMVPEKPPKDCSYHRVPGLFQHIGIHSTLANKTQTLRDSTFSLVRRRFSHVNPPADVVTTIRQYKTFVPRSAYSSAPGMFWGIPKPGDTYDVVFEQPLPVSRIAIITGATLTKKKTRDKLLFGQLQVSPSFERMLSSKRALCSDFVAVNEFQNGEVDAKDLDKRFTKGIQCIRVVIGSKQRTWISISEIAVFVNDGALEAVATPNPPVSDGKSNVMSVKSDVTALNSSGAEKVKNNSNSLTDSEKKKAKLKLRNSESTRRVKRDVEDEITAGRNVKMFSDNLHGSASSSDAASNTSVTLKLEFSPNIKIADKDKAKDSRQVGTNPSFQDANRKLKLFLTDRARPTDKHVISPSDRSIHPNVQNIKEENENQEAEGAARTNLSIREAVQGGLKTSFTEDSSRIYKHNMTLDTQDQFNSSKDRRFRLKKSIRFNGD